MSLLQSVLKSYRSLPLWVQIWVGLLVLVNASAFALLDTPSGRATAFAAVFVGVTNGPLIIYYRGMNRALSIPHLFAWIPLQVFLVQHLAQNSGQIPSHEWTFAMTVLVINGISLVFDVLDSWRWLRGERETPGVTV